MLPGRWVVTMTLLRTEEIQCTIYTYLSQENDNNINLIYIFVSGVAVAMLLKLPTNLQLSMSFRPSSGRGWRFNCLVDNTLLYSSAFFFRHADLFKATHTIKAPPSHHGFILKKQRDQFKNNFTRLKVNLPHPMESLDIQNVGDEHCNHND